VVVGQGLDGAPPTEVELGAGETSFVHDTGGVPTCYFVKAIRTNETGVTDALCALPGAADFPSEGSSAMTLQQEDSGYHTIASSITRLAKELGDTAGED
jgi:hypothetical protein